MQPFDAIDSLEGARALDPLAAGLQKLAAKVTSDPKRRAVMEGRPVGHSAHPMLVQMPIGAWVSAGLLDCVPRTHSAASFLTGVGLVTALPAIGTGLADYRHLDRRMRRVAVVHVAANTLSIAFQLASLRNRLAGRHSRGQWIGLAGTTSLAVGGLLGGHMAHPLGRS
jgi:uncharacterized membrane protein